MRRVLLNSWTGFRFFHTVDKHLNADEEINVDIQNSVEEFASTKVTLLAFIQTGIYCLEFLETKKGKQT